MSNSSDKLKQTMTGMKSPVTDKKTVGIDTALLMEAWKKLIDTQKGLISEIEVTRLDNRKTRNVSLITGGISVVAAILVLGALYTNYRKQEIRATSVIEGMSEVVSQASAADGRLKNVEEQLKAALNAVVAKQAAEVAELEEVEEPTPRRRVRPEVAARKKRVQQKKMVAQAATLKAQIVMAKEEAAPKAKATAELSSLKKKARAAGVSLDEF